MFGRTYCFPQDLTEIKNNIDSNELLESSQTDSNPQHRSNTFRAWHNKIREARTAFSLQAVLDLPHKAIGISANSREDFACSLVFAHENQITRRFGNYDAA